jgi:hypothetical protein
MVDELLGVVASFRPKPTPIGDHRYGSV